MRCILNRIFQNVDGIKNSAGQFCHAHDEAFCQFQGQGFEVIPVSVHDHVTDFKDADFWEYVFPSWEGLKIFRRAFYSYAGTFSYLVRGRISVSDLFHSGPSYLAAPSSWLGRD